MLRKNTVQFRALIYVRGSDAEQAEQLDTANGVCNRHHYRVVGVVSDAAGGTQGYHDAHRMLRHGEADMIIVSSTTVLPDLLESATGSLPGPRVRDILRRRPSPRHHRIRPIPREGGGA